MFGKAVILSALLSAVSAGTTIWDGRFTDTTASELEKWSFSNTVGSYQYYIHGKGALTDYVNISPDFKNPADSSKQGAKITIDDTAKWNSDMWRTELIPQTKAAINKGKVYYHFSMKTSGTNVPSATNEHQIAFFESHFTEMKYGWISGEAGTSNTNLQWMVGGQSKWKMELVADEWHNVAYEIDFDAGSVAFWHSTGAKPLTKTAGPFTASTSSNGADWHLGVLRLPRAGNDGTGAEDWFFSDVYVETGSLTTSFGSGAAEAEAPAASAPAASSAVAVQTPAASSAAPVTSSAAPVAEAPVASPTPVASEAPVAAPSASAGAGAGSGSSATLPEKFTIKQFIAWLKETTGNN